MGCLRLLAAALLAVAWSATPVLADTWLLMRGDRGDYIAGGLTFAFTPADGAFTLEGNTAGVLVTFRTPSSSHRFSLAFAPPSGGLLVPGTYPAAQRESNTDPGHPGLDVSGDGRGCNELTGAFTVKEAIFDGPTPRFWATFEQHCEGGDPALFGEIRINAGGPVGVLAPFARSVSQTSPLSFRVVGLDVEGRRVALRAHGLPEGATFLDSGNSTGVFKWTPRVNQRGSATITFVGEAGGTVVSASTVITVAGETSLVVLGSPGYSARFDSRDGVFGARHNFDNDALISFVPGSGGRFDLHFAAPRDAPLVPGVYPGAGPLTVPLPLRPSLSISGDIGCSPTPRTFEVKQVAYGADSRVESFWATFEADCGAGRPSFVGEIRLRADLPVVVRSPASTSTSPGRPVTIRVTAHDTTGGVVSLAAPGAPGGATFVDHGNNTGTFTWTPGPGDDGVHDISFSGTNTEGASDIARTRIAVHRLTITAPKRIVVFAEQAMSQSITVTRPLGGRVSLTATDVPPGAIFTSFNQSLFWIPTASQAGEYTVKFHAHDGQRVHAYATTRVVVEAPLAITAADYLPLVPGSQWISRAAGAGIFTRTVLDHPVDVNGIATIPVRDSAEGTTRFLTSDGNGIRLHAIELEEEGLRVTFTPPAVLAHGTATGGRTMSVHGQARLQRAGVSPVDVSYASIYRIQEVTSLHVPAGDFEVIRLGGTLFIDSLGRIDDLLDLAHGVGPVRAITSTPDGALTLRLLRRDVPVTAQD